jgi:hypothetical protein
LKLFDLDFFQNLPEYRQPDPEAAPANAFNLDDNNGKIGTEFVLLMAAGMKSGFYQL